MSEITPFMTVRETKDFLRMSECKLRQLIATDKNLPFHRVGKKILFNRDEISNYVMNRGK